MNTPNSDASSQNDATDDTLQCQRTDEASASEECPQAAVPASPTVAAATALQPARRPSELSSNDATANITVDRPCSFYPSTWSKQQIRHASCGCFVSAIVCAVRLLLDPRPSAYIIHSIIILVDMVLIHIFTNTLWLSVAGESTAIIFAICFHLTKETIFELLETTLIAVLVSFHLIKSRNEHWEREKGLQRDIIGLQFYIEHHTNHENENSAEMSTSIVRRQSSVSKLDVGSTGSDADACLEDDVETGAFVPPTDAKDSRISSSGTRRFTATGVPASEERSVHWCNHFFDHFLDGSAGVMYTSFLGLIIDEIVNFGSSPKGS